MPASAASIAREVIVQLKAEASSAAVQARGDLDGENVHATATRGVSGAGGSLPYLDQIQRAFGHHDVTEVRAHVGGPAAEASASLGALAYASGDAVAFAQSPDLHLAAHEAAHVVQQRGGVRLAGGVGREGDEYERNADQVADAVVRGESAQPLLDAYAHRGSGGGSAVQLRREQSRANRLQRQLPVPESYEELEAAVERWIASQVASRSPADGHEPVPGERVPDEQRIHRERNLVRGNPSLRRVWELLEARRGQTVTIVAQLTWGEARVEQIDFSTPVGQLDFDDEVVHGEGPDLTEGVDPEDRGREAGRTFPNPDVGGRPPSPAQIALDTTGVVMEFVSVGMLAELTGMFGGMIMTMVDYATAITDAHRAEQAAQRRAGARLALEACGEHPCWSGSYNSPPIPAEISTDLLVQVTRQYRGRDWNMQLTTTPQLPERVDVEELRVGVREVAVALTSTFLHWQRAQAEQLRGLDEVRIRRLRAQIMHRLASTGLAELRSRDPSVHSGAQ